MHCVEFVQGVERGTGAVLCPHFVEQNLDSREYLRIIRYRVILRNFLTQNINRPIMLCVPCHTSNAAMRYLRGQFPGKVMGKRGD